MKTKSKFVKIDFKDLLNGLLFVVIGSLLGGLIDFTTAMANGTQFSWYVTLASAATAGLTYLKIALFSNSSGQKFKKD